MNTEKTDRSPRGVAKRNGFSPTTIYQEIRDGRLKAKKIRNRPFIPASYEQAWIDNMPDMVVDDNGRLVASS